MLPLTPHSPAIRRALDLLLQAGTYARALGRPAWDFAVEIDELRSQGLTNNDLRWLLCQGYAEQAVELAPVRGNARRFRPLAGLALGGAGSCFVLTAAGATLAGALATEHPPGAVPEAVPTGGRKGGRPVKPKWEAEAGELRLAGRLVRKYKRRAPKQEGILAAFEELGWPARVDDPLSPDGRVDPVDRLRETVRNLNRGQKPRVVAFEAEATGRGVRWQVVP